MKKKRLLNVVSTGILAFSAGAPSVSAAGVPLAIEIINNDKVEEPETGISLLDLIEVKSEEAKKFLSEIYVTLNSDKEIVLYGNISDTYTLTISANGVEDGATIESSDDFNVTVTAPELTEDSILFTILDDQEVVEEISVELQGFFNEFEKETSENENVESISDETSDKTEEVENTPTEDKEDSVVEETEEVENTTPIEDKEDSVSEETEEIPEDVKAEDKEDSVTDEKVSEKSELEDETEVSNDTSVVEEESSEPKVSLERSSEVEELLHGEAATEEAAASTSIMQFNILTTSSTRTHTNGVYTVKSGDTFNAIASSFNISSTQLKYWNTHVTNTSNLVVGTKLAVTRQGVESMLSSTDKNRLYNGGGQTDFSTAQGFINHIAPMAMEIANQSGQEGLYASLMIAQAAHESAYGKSSLASPPYYNLSGIKGSHNGNSVLMWTWEVYSGVRVDVLAGFRQYPSYAASLQDYANLLRNGLSWDRNYYSGTWRSNTNTVWDVLDNGGLRGYATDPNYFAAIRSIITQYDLTQYDGISVQENVAGSKSASYSGTLGSGYSIDTLPWGMTGYQRVGKSDQYSGQSVDIIREAQNGNYALIRLNGVVLGWVDSRAINVSASKISNGIDTNFKAIVKSGGYSIDSLPWGTTGYQRLGSTTSYNDQEVTIVQQTSNGNYFLIQQGNTLIGWIDHRSIQRAVEVENLSSSFPVDYDVTIAKSGYSIDSLPWGTKGYQRIDYTNSYVGRQVQVTHEAGAYALVAINGNPLGWIDRSALSGIPERQNYSAASKVNYSATLRSGYTIDTLPWGVSGYRRISRTNYYAGETVKVLNQTGSYAMIQINGRNLGWVDRRALNR
ncbi:GW dipeptide domain-containing protein [Marinilactibacillus psychrotolerans]|uniref:GW dipeptide domain-containing protein n=1 Tax=Marinilactibacillus psychrotolerans TaxID=191770 RepID=UPI0039B0DD22